MDAQDDIESYPTLPRQFERLRGLPHLLRERRSPSPRFQSYSTLTRALFEALSATSDKPVIVDSSKAPVRAFAFSRVPGIDLRVVHIVRDVRGMISSRRKTFRKDLQGGIEWDHEGHPAWRLAAQWMGLNLLSEWVCARVGPRGTVQLRHEGLSEAPRGGLRKIEPLIRVDLEDVAETASTGGTMRVGHNIGVNRVRISESVTLRPDSREWRNTLSSREQRLS